MSLGLLGLGLGIHRNRTPWLVTTLRGLAARSWIAGRDGSIACTRATARRCVFTGAVLPNNTACYGTFRIPGLGDTRFYLAEPTSTNREPYSDLRASDWQGSGAIKSVNGAYARFTEDLNNSSHRATSSSSITITGSSSYTLSFVVGPATTSPFVTATFGTAWSPTRIVATANLSTGAIGGGVSGGVFPLSDGAKLVSFTFNSNAAPTANNVPIGMSLTGSETYVGVGNFMDIKDVQLEAAFVPGARIDTSGASVTHDADLLEWTPPTPIGSDCAIWGIYIPLAWSAGAGVGMPGGRVQRMFEALSDGFRMYTQSNVVLDRTDSTANVRTSSISSVDARAHAVGSSFLATTVGAYSRAYHDLQVGPSSGAGTLPFPSASAIRMGNRTGSTDRALSGVIAMGTCPSITNAERLALNTIAKSLSNKFVL